MKYIDRTWVSDMINALYKKKLIFSIVLFAIMMTAIIVLLNIVAFNKDFPEVEDVLTIILIYGFCVVPFSFLISFLAKKANSRIIYIIFTINKFHYLIVLLGFCIGFVLMCVLSNSHIEDTNGIENTSLAVIKLDEVLTSEDDFAAFSRGESFNGIQTNVDGELKKYDWQVCSFKSNKISGIKVLQATKTNSQNLVLDFTSKVEQGNVEIVIMVDGEYYTSVSPNESCSITLTDIAGKAVVVKLAAESASVNISVSRTLR